MKTHRDWKALVAGHAKMTGADLPQHTIDELAAHLEDIYTEALKGGAPDAQAYRLAETALSESPLATVPRKRARSMSCRQDAA